MIVSNDTGPRSGASTSAQAWMRALEATARIGEDPRRIFPAVINENAERFATAPALLSDRESMSYGELAGRARQYARWALDQKIAAGAVVALLMPNRPEFVAIWLGLTQIGAVVALLNTRLVGDSLAHCLAIAGPDHVIVEAELADAVFEIALGDAPAPQVWLHGAERPGYERIDTAVARYGNHALSAEEVRPVTLSDPALFIYTSGTTGLPKAARVSHHRIMMWCSWFAGMTDARTEDRMYNCLPMYHSVGGVVATGATLVGGGAVILRERFSASGFWADVTAERCTLLQYIGELCRYLLSSAVQPEETRHVLRTACGNGLRADVWVPFQERFRIPQILEYYAATEGNFSLYNCEGRAGAIGRIPPFLAHRLPVALVKFDLDTGLPLRTVEGRCQRCAAEEVGEAIGQIVGEQGASGFFYFVDRVGDTFRWKGENVSTTELAGVIAQVPGVTDVAVYGVEVPRADGRAGMAALVVAEGFELEVLRRTLVAQLPAYARPVFLRILPTLELTGTFKLRKQELMQQGYNPAQVRDALFIDSAATGRYLPLDAARFEQLKSGALRV
jgi:fatty-acyl-CoA synthase